MQKGGRRRREEGWTFCETLRTPLPVLNGIQYLLKAEMKRAQKKYIFATFLLQEKNHRLLYGMTTMGNGKNSHTN